MHYTSSLCVDSAYNNFSTYSKFCFRCGRCGSSRCKKVKGRVPSNPASARSNTIPMRCSRHILPKDKRDLELHPVKYNVISVVAMFSIYFNILMYIYIFTIHLIYLIYVIHVYLNYIEL